ncbi:MAG: TIGR02466 family protein [Planctomycetota bacterium]
MSDAEPTTAPPPGQIKVQAQMAFCTPLVAGMLEDADAFNAELRQKILALRESSPGVQRGNVGGWHSESDLLQKLGEPFAGSLGRMFLQLIQSAMQAVKAPIEAQGNQRVEAWATVNEKGNSHRPHIHPGCPWSGVYYVATDPGNHGELRFTDPRPAALMIHHALAPWNQLNQVRIDPKPGMMVVFPSFLYHAVENYAGDEPRISISMNLR